MLFSTKLMDTTKNLNYITSFEFLVLDLHWQFPLKFSELFFCRKIKMPL